VPQKGKMKTITGTSSNYCMLATTAGRNQLVGKLSCSWC